MKSSLTIRSKDTSIHNMFIEGSELTKSLISAFGDSYDGPNRTNHVLPFKRAARGTSLGDLGKRVVTLEKLTSDRVFEHFTTIGERQPANARGSGKLQYRCPISDELKEWPVQDDGRTLVPMSELGF